MVICILFIFTEYKNTHIEANLVEYPDINGMMIYEDATRKKKVYDWKKEIPLNKQIVAKVEEIFSDNYIKLSTGYFDNRKDPIELTKELMKPFVDNKIIINIISKICKNNNIDFNKFWLTIIYKLDNERRKDNINDISLFDYIKSNIDNFNNDIMIFFPENSNNIIQEFNKLTSIKNEKFQTKFSLITKKSIENTIQLLKNTCENNNELCVLKYESTPIFILESINNESHEQFLKYIEDNCQSYDIEYKKI